MANDPPDGALTHLWVRDIRENDRVKGFYLAREKRLGTTRRGEPFMTILLSDCTGDVEAKVWERVSELAPLFHEGDILEVEGQASSYRGQVQLTLASLKPGTENVDAALFLESSPRDASDMMQELRGILRGMGNAHLRSLVDLFLSDHEFVSLFKKAPAAKNFHHSYIGGLLEHTLSVCNLAIRVAQHYPQLDADLLLTSAFLHDIGKVRELEGHFQIEYTDEGRLLGHLVTGVVMLEKRLEELKNFPRGLSLLLKHLFLSHHGEYEFGSPKKPKLLEGFALHLIDDLDAKINGLERFMERDRKEGAWTGFNRLVERYLLKGEIFPGDSLENECDEREEKQGVLFSSLLRGDTGGPASR
jgi:3'-5' exoribonuclease